MFKGLSSLRLDRGGNIAISFALILVPMITAVGMSLDYARAYNVRSKMQADLDIALLAAVKAVGTSDSAAIKLKIKNWFAAQTDIDPSSYNLDDITIDTTNEKITASTKVSVATSLLQIVDIPSVDVGVASSVAGPGKSYLNVYVVLDKSASMLLAATSAGQAALTSSSAKCAFACHTSEGTTYTYNKKSYTTVYDLAEAMGVQLRTDVALNAVSEVLDMIDTTDSSHARIKVGLYTIGKTATQVLAPTTSTSSARKKLTDDTAGMNSATSENATYFDYSMTALKTLVGTAGDGSSSSTPRKLVLILTDGVQSERNWVLQSGSGIRFPSSTSTLQKDVTPLNPAWCDGMKNLGASLAVLYTEYLPITTDWGYNATLGKTMATSNFASIWGGSYASAYAGTTRQAYIPTALKACSSSSDLFLQANSPDEIEAGLLTLFQQYLAKVRLIS